MLSLENKSFVRSNKAIFKLKQEKPQSINDSKSFFIVQDTPKEPIMIDSKLVPMTTCHNDSTSVLLKNHKGMVYL